MLRLFTCRFRDGIGRWNAAYLRADDIGLAMIIAQTRYGQYRDLHAVYVP